MVSFLPRNPSPGASITGMVVLVVRNERADPFDQEYTPIAKGRVVG